MSLFFLVVGSYFLIFILRQYSLGWAVPAILFSFFFGLTALITNLGYLADHTNKITITGNPLNIWNLERAYRIVAKTYELPTMAVLSKDKIVNPLIKITNIEGTVLDLKLNLDQKGTSKFTYADNDFIVFPSENHLIINGGDYKVVSHLVGWLANGLENGDDELSLIESAKTSGNWKGNEPQTFTSYLIGNYCLENGIQKNDLRFFECARFWLGRANLSLRNNNIEDEAGSVTPNLCLSVINNFAIANLATIKENGEIKDVKKLFEIALKCNGSEDKMRIVRYNLEQVKGLVP